MTALVSTDIGCDVCDAVLPAVKWDTKVRASKARELAIMCGWVIKQRMDLCPACAKDMNDQSYDKVR